MRALKIIGLSVGVLLVLLIGGAAVLLAVVDPNDYRDDIERLAREHTGRELTIGGELDLDLFPWLALRIEKVTLGNPPGYGEQPFLTIGRASVGVKLLPLIRKRIEVSRIAVEQLALTLVSRSDKENNWSDLTDSDEPTGTEDEGAAGTQTSIAGLEVKRSQIVYRDLAEASVLRLHNIEARAGEIGGDDPVPVQVEFDYDKGEAQPLAHVKLAARARMPAEGSKLELAEATVEGTWGKVPFEARTPALALDLDAETLAPATLDIRFGALPMKLTARGERLFGERLVTGSVSLPRSSPRELMRSLEMEIPNTSDPKALTALSVQADYRLTDKALSVPKLDLVLDDSRIRGSAGIEDLESFALAFDLTIDGIDVDRYLEPEAEGARDEGARAAPDAQPTELPIEALRELNARGRLVIGRAKLADLEFADVRLPLEARTGLVRLGPTSARLFGGKYAGNTVLDVRPAQARLSMDERVSGIDIGALMQATFDSTRLSGRADATAVLNGRGNTDQAILDSLSGKTAFEIREGAVNGIDLWYELRRARALWQRQTPPERSGPPRTAFNVFKGTALLDAGVVRNEDLRVETDYLRAGGKGTISLDSQAIDYRVVAEVYRLPPEGAGAEMTDLKAAEIPITITGSLAEPRVRPDLGGLVKARVKQKVDEEVDKRKEEVKQKLGEKLRDLLER